MACAVTGPGEVAVNVTYTENAKYGDAYALLQQATERLKKILGTSADRVSVEWDRGQDVRGRAQYTLKLSDHTGQVAASFAPDELSLSAHMRYRLLDLWGDLLQVRSHKLLQELTGAGGQA